MKSNPLLLCLLFAANAYAHEPAHSPNQKTEPSQSGFQIFVYPNCGGDESAGALAPESHLIEIKNPGNQVNEMLQHDSSKNRPYGLGSGQTLYADGNAIYLKGVDGHVVNLGTLTACPFTRGQPVAIELNPSLHISETAVAGDCKSASTDENLSVPSFRRPQASIVFRTVNQSVHLVLKGEPVPCNPNQGDFGAFGHH